MMGPDAYRTAELAETLTALGHVVTDIGDVTPAAGRDVACANPLVHSLSETVAWQEALSEAAVVAAGKGFPIFMGGDHALSLGSVAGMAAHAESRGRPLFVLWLDAHTDLHTPLTTDPGNLHGTPLAYIAGFGGFEAFAPMPNPVRAANICLIGLRSVDAAEKAMLNDSDMSAVDMRAIDERGIGRPLSDFLGRVAAANGLLHVSLDVDFLDPAIAPAVGTTVPGGATFREAHLVMEMLDDSGLVTSLDLVELNPFLDDRGRTARLMVDLTASLLGPAGVRPSDRNPISRCRRIRRRVMTGPKPSEMAFVPFVSVENMMRSGPPHRHRADAARAGRVYRGRFPPLGAVRQDTACRVAFRRRRDRADADQRRRELWLQIRQRPPGQHGARFPDRDCIRRAGTSGQWLPHPVVGNDGFDRAAHCGDLRNGGATSRAEGRADDGDDRQRRAVRIPGAGDEGGLRS